MARRDSTSSVCNVRDLLLAIHPELFVLLVSVVPVPLVSLPRAVRRSTVYKMFSVRARHEQVETRFLEFGLALSAICDLTLSMFCRVSKSVFSLHSRSSRSASNSVTQNVAKPFHARILPGNVLETHFDSIVRHCRGCLRRRCCCRHGDEDLGSECDQGRSARNFARHHMGCVFAMSSERLFFRSRTSISPNSGIDVSGTSSEGASAAERARCVACGSPVVSDCCVGAARRWQVVAD